jgi:putative peptidoglycan lipid II flippase
VLLAGVVQLLFQLPFLYRLELLPAPRWSLSHPGVRQVLTLMVPALFGVSVSQVNLLLDTVLASFLPTGSVSWLYYSDRLTELPLGVFGIAIATVILPALSAHSAAQRPEAFSVTLDWALRMVLLVAVPAALALIISRSRFSSACSTTARSRHAISTWPASASGPMPWAWCRSC